MTHTKSGSIGHAPVQPQSAEPNGGETSRRAFTVRLQQLVNESGSKNAFAGLAGVTQRTVRLWMEGGEPGRDSLAAIAQATGVSLDWLIAGRGRKIYSEYPAGYIPMPFVDLRKSKGILTGSFLSTDKRVFVHASLLDLTEGDFATRLEPRVIDRGKIDPRALLLPPSERDSDAADFIVFDLTKEDAEPPAEGVLCVVILDKGKVEVRPARSSTGITNMFGPILGPVIFRGAIVRRDSDSKTRGSKP